MSETRRARRQHLESLKAIQAARPAFDAVQPKVRRRRRSSAFVDQLREPKKERPPQYPARRPDVLVGLRVITLRDIDVVKQCFSCKFDLFVGWQAGEEAEEADAAHEQGGEEGEDWPQGRRGRGGACTRWVPRVTFRNAIEVRQRSGHRAADVKRPARDQRGELVFPLPGERWQQVFGTFSEPLDIYEFPLDEQHLTIYMRMEEAEDACNVRELPMTLDEASVDVLPSVMLNDYIVCAPRMVIMYVPSFEFGQLVNFDPVVHAKLVVVRRHESYMYRTAAVSGILPCVGLLTGFVDATKVEERISINATLLLTLAALQFLQGDALPKVPYLTLLDKYLLFCFFFLVILCAENGFVTLFEDADERVRADGACYLAVLVVYCLCNALALRYVQQRKIVIQDSEVSHIRKQNARVDETRKQRKQTRGTHAHSRSGSGTST
eukprot:g5477.t1